VRRARGRTAADEYVRGHRRVGRDGGAGRADGDRHRAQPADRGRQRGVGWDHRRLAVVLVRAVVAVGDGVTGPVCWDVHAIVAHERLDPAAVDLVRAVVAVGELVAQPVRGDLHAVGTGRGFDAAAGDLVGAIGAVGVLV